MDPLREPSLDASQTEVGTTQTEILDTERVGEVITTLRAIRAANKTNADILKSYHEASSQGVDAGYGAKGNKTTADELVKLLELLPGITLTDSQKAEVAKSIYTDGNLFKAYLWEDIHSGNASLDNSWSSVQVKSVFNKGSYLTGVIVDAVYDLEGRRVTLAFDERNNRLNYVTLEMTKHSGYPYQSSSLARAMVMVDNSGKVLEQTGEADALGSFNLEQELKALTSLPDQSEELSHRD